MKTKYLFLLLFVLRATMSFAQGDILKDSIRTEGIYLTFDEFRNNTPSLRGRVLVLEKKIKLYDSAERRFMDLEEDFWGACSNNYVYVGYRRFSNSKPLPFLLESVDRYCFFKASVTNRNSFNNMPGPNSEYGEFVINMNDGKTYKLSNELMKTILQPDPELLALYEKDKERNKNFKKYILEYNTKHRDEIKPISR